MEQDWARILSAHGPTVWRLLRCLVGHEADARDCYQSVFLVAFQFSKKQPVGDWEKLLNRLARCRGIDLLRKRYRTAARIEDNADPGDSLSRIPGPEAEVETAELTEKLRVGLGLLPQQQSEVFVMRFVEQLSYDEIASRVGSPPTSRISMTAASRRHSAKITISFHASVSRTCRACRATISATASSPPASTSSATARPKAA